MFDNGEKEEEKDVIKRIFWRIGNLEFEIGKWEIMRRIKKNFFIE